MYKRELGPQYEKKNKIQEGETMDHRDIIKQTTTTIAAILWISTANFRFSFILYLVSFNQSYLTKKNKSWKGVVTLLLCIYHAHRTRVCVCGALTSVMFAERCHWVGAHRKTAKQCNKQRQRQTLKRYKIW